jgi:hypothetical protein
MIAAALLSALATPPAHAVIRAARGPSAANADSAALSRTLASVGPVRAGYVHYFRLTHPDGTLEDQVGIELEDRRIAWSFPGAGVIVSDFILKGSLTVDGNTIRIEHRYGVRPFRSARDMQALRAALPQRVAFWVDQETPYCIIREPGQPFCLNCGDFVLHVLFPSASPGTVSLPAELTRRSTATPDDLLLYMIGLYGLPDAQTRLDRLARLDLPGSLRSDLQDMLRQDLVPAATGTALARSPAPKKPLSRVVTRSTQRKAL